MPLHVNEFAINELAALTGIPADKLKSEIVVDAAEPPKETKIKDVLADVVIMKKTDHATLLDNTGKAKFDEGKHRAHIDLTKVALGDKAFDVTKDMTREQLWEKIVNTVKPEWEKESGKPADEKLRQWEKEKAELQKLIAQKDEEVVKVNQKLTETTLYNTKQSKVLAAVSAIPFTATGEILSQQRDTLTQIVLNSYQYKVEDGKTVWYDLNGNKQVDTLQNPKTIEDIVKEKAVIFPTTKADNGRSDGSSKQNNPSSGELDAELAKITTNEQFVKFMSARGLSPISEEGKTLMSKWVAMQSKKP